MNAEQTNIYQNPLLRKKTATFQSTAHYMYTIDINTTMLYRLFLDGPLQFNHKLYRHYTSM